MISASLAEVEGFFAGHLARAVEAGDMASDTRVEETAQALLGLFLGLRVLTRAGAAPATRNAITSQAMAMMEG